MKRVSPYVILVAMLLLLGCSSKLKQENEALRNEIDQRREALQNKQQTELQQARDELAVTDSLLEAVTTEHDTLHEWVMAHSTELNDQSEPVIRLNTLRARRDSLHVRAEVLSAKVVHILRVMHQ